MFGDGGEDVRVGGSYTLVSKPTRVPLSYMFGDGGEDVRVGGGCL
jgi:hypothetical protein